MSKALTIFASGGGSNAEEIIEYFSNTDIAHVNLILSNKPDAYVLTRALNHNIPHQVISKEDFQNEKTLITLLRDHKTDYIILAGFLWLIPPFLIKNYPKRIINIHPSILPKYGGKGMYGNRVHQAVFDNNERVSGMTIHYVDEAYDEGQIIHQSEVALDSMDTPDVIAKKVLALEHAHYAKVIEQVIREDLS